MNGRVPPRQTLCNGERNTQVHPAIASGMAWQEAAMKIFQVRQRITDSVLWVGSAHNEVGALDAMAHEAGYYDYSDLPDEVRHGGLMVEAVTLKVQPMIISQS